MYFCMKKIKIKLNKNIKKSTPRTYQLTNKNNYKAFWISIYIYIYIYIVKTDLQSILKLASTINQSEKDKLKQNLSKTD